MPKKAAGLTARRVETEKVPGLYADGGGLYLKVAPSGARSWVYRYQIAGRRRDMGLGTVAVYKLAEARERAREARRLVADGIDPLEHRAGESTAAMLAAARAMTFRRAAESYIEAMRPGWRSAIHARQWPATLEKYVYPLLGKLPVDRIDTALVLKVLQPIWTEHPETASRVRGRIESVLDWAAARGYRHGDNPARWRGHLRNLLPATSRLRRIVHHPALPYPEIGAFMVELRRQEGIAARALEFLILTAARSGEVRGAVWTEFNLAERLWTVPPERMKAGREHRVPLSDPALVIVERLDAVPRQGLSELVFPLGPMAMSRVLKGIPGGVGLTTHGFRSTFRDYCAELTAYPYEVAELALAHGVGNATARAYQRGDLFEKRRRLMDDWGQFCAAQPASGSVVPIRGAAAMG